MQALVTRPGERHATHVADVAEPNGEGVRIRVLDHPSQINAKRAAGRPRDFDHLPELEALLALRKT